MAGRGNISVNQTAQHGDKTAIERLKKSMTETPMTGNPTPAPTAGRPPGGGAQQPAQQGGAPAPSNVPPEHQQMADAVAEAYRTKIFWDKVLQEHPSEWSRLYAADATRAYQRAAMALRNGTPFFE